MVRRTIVHLEDDLSGGDAAESVVFALDGRAYEIDLNEQNADRLRQVLAPYIAAGRVVRSGHGGRRAFANGDGQVDPATIRAWAQANGYAISNRGRVSREVREAYYSAAG